MKVLKTLAAIAIISLTIMGCATNQPLMKPGEFSGTSAELDGVKISYSIAKKNLLGYDGLILHVELANLQGTTTEFSPEVLLIDSSKKVVAMPALEMVLSAAAREAGRPVPSEFLSPSANYSSFTGTARDRLTGTQYAITGNVVRGNSFSRGFEMGTAIGAAANRREGAAVMDWAAAKWLKANYRLPPRVSFDGELFMPLFDKKISDPSSRLLIINNSTANMVELYLPPFVRD